MGGLHNTSTLIGGDGKGLDLYPGVKSECADAQFGCAVD